MNHVETMRWNYERLRAEAARAVRRMDIAHEAWLDAKAAAAEQVTS